MHIVIAGASGFLGRPLLAALSAAGHQVTQLVRAESSSAAAAGVTQQLWDPQHPIELPTDTSAVINLCGVGVGDHRWTKAYRRQIRLSRIVPTSTLADAVHRQRIPLLLNASGVACYGDTGNTEVREDAPQAPPGFLADMQAEWEQAATAAAGPRTRVVLLRTGLPLHRAGGLLGPQLLPFRLGLGGKLGSGRHWVPWISRADWISAVQFLLDRPEIDGSVNLVGPAPVTNAEFTKEFAAVLHRPAIMRIPRFALRVAYGEFADEAFRSIRALPGVLAAQGFEFAHPTVREALRAAFS